MMMEFETDDDKVMTKEVSYHVHKIGPRKATIRVPKDSCSMKNCNKKGKIFIVPVLQMHDPFWLCSSHWKKVSIKIIEERKKYLRESQDYDLIWARKGARVITQAQAEALVSREAEIDELKKWGRGFRHIWKHHINVHQIGDKIFVPLEWVESLLQGQKFEVISIEGIGEESGKNETD